MFHKNDDRQQKSLGSTISYTIALLIGVIVLLSLLSALVLLLLFFAEDQEYPDTNTEDALTYAGITYHLAEDLEHLEGYESDIYVDLLDLGVKPLPYSHYGFGDSGTPLIERKHRLFSNLDDIVAPTQIFTLDYTAWESFVPFYIHYKEKDLREAYDGEITAAAFDYGADSAYWLGDTLLLRYGDSHLLVFHEKTTKALIDSQACADFMREEMVLPEPTWY